MTKVIARQPLANWDDDFTLKDYELKGATYEAVSKKYRVLADYFNFLSAEYDREYRFTPNSQSRRQNRAAFLAARLEMGLVAHMAACLYTLCKKEFEGQEPEGFIQAELHAMWANRAFNRQVATEPREKPIYGQIPKSTSKKLCPLEDEQKVLLSDPLTRNAAIEILIKEHRKNWRYSKRDTEKKRLEEPHKMTRYLSGLQRHTPIRF